ncbi:McrB family protein [Mycetocola saprophilus]|uniref:McrB family protein n=1 Tax=Mycetocola saprophilus TaxID=76636 RepID=UPI003BF24992
MSISIGTNAAPKWLVNSPQDEADKYEDVLSWTGEGDEDFLVSVPQLEELLDAGYRPVTKYYFSVRGLGGEPIVPTQWCSKLGAAVHDRVISRANPEQIDSLRVHAEAVGGVLNWAAGFASLLRYLHAAEKFAGIDTNSLTIEGRPGNALLSAVKHVPSDVAQTEPNAPAPRFDEDERQIIALLESELNVIVEGVAGSGKSHLLKMLEAEYNEVEVVVFHPSTTYEDFVAGLRPVNDGGFRCTPGAFIDICRRAARSPQSKFLLFIDEINRANTSRVLGDLLLPLEKTKRVRVDELGLTDALLDSSPRNVTSVRLQTPVSEQLSGTEFVTYSHLIVPANLHVLGTMNSTDRSVGSIDLALRRRFIWQELHPLPAHTLRERPEFAGKLRDDADWETVLDWYQSVNEALRKNPGPDALLGHAYIFSASSPFIAATGLAAQLAEVIFIFNLPEKDLQDIPSVDLNGAGKSLRVEHIGTGLGRRPRVIVDELSADSSKTLSA